MEELRQEYILSILFAHAIRREELSIEKYINYYDHISTKDKNKELPDLLKEYEKNAREHISLLKDKMIKLNIQG